MGKKGGGESRHDQLVGKLEMQLFSTHDYEKMWKFMEYCRNGQVGEVDLLAMADGLYDFYEVKCTFHSKSHKKAREQFDRYRLAFPRQEVKGFMYSSNRGLMKL